MRRTLALLFLATVTAGCGSRTAQNVPLGKGSAGDALTGSVQEQLAAPPYVYLRLKTSTGDVWAAVPQVRLENGANVTVHSPMLMTDFESTTLHRTFHEVYFGTLEASNASATAASGDPHAGAGQATAPFDVGTVEKAPGPDARTVAEVWAQKASLEGKAVTIRGKVVKHNDQVMGKNWIHLQDGSGDAGSGTNDLTVTSLDAVEIGQTITITGTVRTNKDFGYGYVYPVMVEDAKVRKN